jgi:hypothetical protein
MINDFLWKTPASFFRVKVSCLGIWVNRKAENYHLPVPSKALKEVIYIHIRHN